MAVSGAHGDRLQQPVQKGLEKSMDRESIRILRKGTGRDVCSNVPNPGNVKVGEGCEPQEAMQTLPAGFDGSKVSPTREFFCHSKGLHPTC